MGKIKKQKVVVPSKDLIITIRISHEWQGYLKKVGELVEADTGQAADRTWVIKQLMKFGQADFEKKYGIRKKA